MPLGIHITRSVGRERPPTSCQKFRGKSFCRELCALEESRTAGISLTSEGTAAPSPHPQSELITGLAPALSTVGGVVWGVGKWNTRLVCKCVCGECWWRVWSF